MDSLAAEQRDPQTTLTGSYTKVLLQQQQQQLLQQFECWHTTSWLPVIVNPCRHWIPAAVFIAVSVLETDSMTHHFFVETTVSNASAPLLFHSQLVPVKFTDLFLSLIPLPMGKSFYGNSFQLYLYPLSATSRQSSPKLQNLLDTTVLRHCWPIRNTI